MYIQIETVSKTIKLAETVNFKDLLEVLDKLFPNKEWLEYKLETNTIINNWSNPTIIYRDRYWPTYPWNQPTITWATSNGNVLETFTASQGTYNLSIN